VSVAKFLNFPPNVVSEAKCVHIRLGEEEEAQAQAPTSSPKLQSEAL